MVVAMGMRVEPQHLLGGQKYKDKELTTTPGFGALSCWEYGQAIS